MKLKKTHYFFIIVLLIGTYSFGQESIKTNFSLTSGVKIGFFDGIGGGPVLYQEFNYALYDRIIVSPKIQIGFANETSETQFMTGTDIEFGLNLKLIPFYNYFNRLKICVDLGTFNFTNRWAADILNYNYPEPDYEKEVLNAPRSWKTSGINFSYGIDFDVIKKGNLIIGLTGMINPIFQRTLESRNNDYNPNLYDFGVYSRILIMKNKLKIQK